MRGGGVRSKVFVYIPLLFLGARIKGAYQSVLLGAFAAPAMGLPALVPRRAWYMRLLRDHYGQDGWKIALTRADSVRGACFSALAVA